MKWRTAAEVLLEAQQLLFPGMVPHEGEASRKVRARVPKAKKATPEQKAIARKGGLFALRPGQKLKVGRTVWDVIDGPKKIGDTHVLFGIRGKRGSEAALKVGARGFAIMRLSAARPRFGTAQPHSYAQVLDGEEESKPRRAPKKTKSVPSPPPSSEPAPAPQPEPQSAQKRSAASLARKAAREQKRREKEEKRRQDALVSRDRSKAAIEATPWRYSYESYYRALGIPLWGGMFTEYSPMQWARMSRAQQRRIEKKRGEESDARAKAHAEWARLVMAAFEAGKFRRDDPDVSEEARRLVIQQEIEDDKRRGKALLRQAREENRIPQGELRKGMRVYNFMHSQYGTITRVSKKSSRVQYDSPRGFKEGPTLVKNRDLLYRSPHEAEQEMKEKNPKLFSFLDSIERRR